MAKAKYLTDVDDNKIYPIGHTKAVYDENGTVLEDRLTSNEQNIDSKVESEGGDVSNTTVDFTQSDSRSEISSGSTLGVIFGKIKKWLADLKTVAFTGSYNDLSDTPTSMTPTSHASANTIYGKGDSTNYGHVKLSNSTSSSYSTSDGHAATPSAVKAAYDLANGKADADHTHSKSDITDFPTIPTQTSQLTNNSDFQTSAQVSSAIQTAISKTGHASFKKVDALPSYSSAESNVLYLLKNTKTGKYDIYAKVDGSTQLELLDDTTVDLSAYSTTAQMNAALAGKSNTGHKHTKAEITDFPASMPASDVPSWAKQSNKPSYNYSEINNKPSSFTPSSHASTGTTYGKGDGSYYGHVKLSDSTGSTSGASGGIAATPSAVKSAYDLANRALTAATGITSPATYVVSTQAEFEAAIDAVNSSANGGKVILREGTFTLTKRLRKNIIFDGMGHDSTAIEARNFLCDSVICIFKDLTLTVETPDYCSGTTIRVINCKTQGTGNGDRAMFWCRNLYITGGTLSCKNTPKLSDDECYSCFYGDMGQGDTVEITECDITLDGGSTYHTDYDINLIYGYFNYIISNCSITCTGEDRTNIVDGGTGIITGCSIILMNDKATIYHADTKSKAEGPFTGNCVEYYKTYLSASAVSGNQFKHMAAGTSSSNQIILQCPTNMTGNTFTGDAAYIDGQNKTHIIDRNLHDNGLTINNKSSSSVTSNNLQY